MLGDALRIRDPRQGRESLILLTPGIMEERFGYLPEALESAGQDVVRQRIRHVRKTLRLTDYYVQREFIYKRIDTTEGLTSKTFAEMVSNANAMHHLTLAVRRYMQEHILDDPLTFHAGLWPKRDRKWSKPQYLGLDSYYCEIGAGVSGFLMNQERNSWEKGERPTQEQLSKALHQRFDELSKLLQEPYRHRFRGSRARIPTVPAPRSSAATAPGRPAPRASITPTTWACCCSSERVTKHISPSGRGRGTAFAWRPREL